MHDLLYTLAYHFKGSEKRIQKFIDTKAFSKIIELAANYLN